jgi:hypothetical protein
VLRLAPSIITTNPLSIETIKVGERQLSWPVDDNYLGRFVT